MTREEIEHEYESAVDWANAEYRDNVLGFCRVRDVQIEESENDPQRVEAVAWALLEFEYAVKEATRSWDRAVCLAERKRDAALAALATEESS